MNTTLRLGSKIRGWFTVGARIDCDTNVAWHHSRRTGCSTARVIRSPTIRNATGANLALAGNQRKTRRIVRTFGKRFAMIGKIFHPSFGKILRDARRGLIRSVIWIESFLMRRGVENSHADVQIWTVPGIWNRGPESNHRAGANRA